MAYISSRIFSASLEGIDAQLIEVEVDSAPGLHVFSIVGLPDKAVQESKDRIASALRNSGLAGPSSQSKKIIVNLAPADIKKEGPSYDLPIAIGYLAESKQLKFDSADYLLTGELSLDGSLKPTNGVLAMAILAKDRGFKEFVVPLENAQEAAIIEGIKVIGAKNITEVVGYLNGTIRIPPTEATLFNPATLKTENSFAFIKGQASAKRALVVAAAGAHNVLLYGAPGSGKTILAKALCDILPPLTAAEAIEVTKIYSSVGLVKNAPLSWSRPFRSPHHTTSPAAVIGGGSWPRPGEISLAHRGVLFLDELPEFHRNVLESLRQPLEDGTVTIARASGSVTLPAKFAFTAAMNPCPCGNFGDESAICVCSTSNVLRYKKRVSGPLLDRIDIQVAVPRENVQENKADGAPDDIGNLRKAIVDARQIQANRFKDKDILTNSEISYKNIDQFCLLSPAAEKLLKHTINSKRLSLRAYHRIKKVARTIADLENSENIQENHIAEAVGLRTDEEKIRQV